MTDLMTRMTRPQCLEHLAGHTVGRIAVTAHAMPAIVPVNYRLRGDQVVFRTKSDGMLARACDDSVVAFEVDDIAADGSGGWSVLAVGVARLLIGSDALRAIQLNLASAMGEGRDQFVEITLARISGRKVGSQAARAPMDGVIRQPAVAMGGGNEGRS